VSRQLRLCPPGARRPLLVLAAAALAAALAAAGCGSASSGSGASSARVSLLRAADVTNAAAGYRAAFHLTLRTASLPSAIAATGSGSFDPAAHSGALSIAMSFGGVPQVTAVLGGSTLRMREILEGKRIYIGLPAALASKLPGGRPWLSVNLAKLASRAGIPGLSSLLDNPASADPAQFLQYLRAVSGRVRTIGSATIDGRRTTGYRATIDLSKAARVAPAAERQTAAQAIAAIERETGLRRVPVEVWIDGQHLVRRIVVTMTENLPSTGQRLTTAITADILSYGPQPTPQLPPASQVTDLDSLIGAQAG
jgi:hypothetical protein